MKLKALMLALFVAGLTASFALAGDGGHGKGKGMREHHAGAKAAKTAAARPCRPRIELQLAGTVASGSDDSLAVLVEKGRAQGASLKGAQLTLDISKARVRGTLAAGGKVRAHARACVDLAAGTVRLVATQVRFATAGADETTSSTTTTTTTTSG